MYKWNFTYDEGGAEFAYLDILDVTVIVSNTGFISIYPLEVADEALRYIDMRNRSIRNDFHDITKVERDEDYVYVYFSDTEEDEYLQIKATEEGLIFDWWQGDSHLDTAAVEWDDIAWGRRLERLNGEL